MKVGELSRQLRILLMFCRLPVGCGSVVCILVEVTDSKIIYLIIRKYITMVIFILRLQ